MVHSAIVNYYMYYGAYSIFREVAQCVEGDWRDLLGSSVLTL